MKVEELIEYGLTSLGVPFDDAALRGLAFLAEEIHKWNAHVNLVGLKDVESIVRELLYDAFHLNSYVRGSASLLDMGSGAGILAIPLKILNMDMEVFSVDKSLKKIQFQRHIQRLLHLAGFMPLHARLESMGPLSVQTLVVKAFGTIPDILAQGGRHMRKDAMAFILKGKTEEAAEHDGFTFHEKRSYRLPESPKTYRLLMYRKS